MKSHVAVTLILVGGLLVIGPLAAHEFSKERGREHIAELFARVGNAAVLPDEMQTKYGPYDWACLAVGVGMIVSGIWGVRSIPLDHREAAASK